METEAHEYAEFFSAIPFFKDLNPEAWELLAASAMERTYWPGEKVVEQGAIGDTLFVILEGEFKISVLQEEFEFERELARLKPGDHFGETAMLTEQKRPASLTAATAGRALLLQGPALRDLLRENPDFALALCQAMARHLEQITRLEATLAFVKLDDYPELLRTIRLLPQKISNFCKALVVSETGDRVLVGMVNPGDTKIRNLLRDNLSRYQIEFAAIGERDFDSFASKHLHAHEAAQAGDDEALFYIDSQGKEHELGDPQTADLLEGIFSRAIRCGASDLHFEPGEPDSRVRMRMDGNMMVLENQIANALFTKMISRLKIISGLDITIRRLPQDGRFPVKSGKRRVEVRVSVTPCQGGEKAVLRILDPNRQRLDLQDLIISRTVCQAVREVCHNSSGMILVTGPTGAGKTTTLYAALSEIWKKTQSVNIVTIEDPVEYQLDYATQIQVNRAVDLDFAQILRAALRQDPDVILVGEIRDSDSASIALETATIGHLVLSSLHTDSAVEALFRLRKLQVKSYLLASALKTVISQRLVSRVCENCKHPIPSGGSSEVAMKEMGILANDWRGTLYTGKGCEVCRFEGERGRCGVYELLMVDEQLRELIEHDAHWGKLQESLSRSNYISMASYCRYLLLEGLVAPDQVRGVFPRYAISGGMERRSQEREA